MADEAGPASRPPRDPAAVVDEVPRRLHRPLDLVRVCGLLVLLAAVAGFATVAHATVQGANDDVTRLLATTPALLRRGLKLLGTLSVLALPVALVTRELARSHLRRLIEGLVTGLVAIGVVGALDLAISAASTTALHRALTVVGHSTAARPLDAYLAALFAFAVAIGVGTEPRWRATFWILTGIYLVSAFAAAQASLLSLIASPAIGALVAVLVRYAVGSPNVRPDAGQIAAVLADQGLDLVRIERVPALGDEHRGYLARDTSGRQIRVFAFDRDLVASGAIHGLYRRLRLRRDVAVPAALSLERAGERQVALALAAQAARVRIPALRAAVPCAAECLVLAYDVVEGSPAEVLDDAQLADLWRQADDLNRRRIAHRGLTAGRLLIDADGQVVLPILTDGELFASDTRIRLDRAQLLVTTALLVGAERAVKAARECLSEDELAASLPLLQPIALSRTARSALKRNQGLLEAVREQIRQQTARPLPPPARVERFRPRTVVSIAAALIAGYLLIGQLGSVDLVTVFSTAHWAWVPLVLLASVGTYVAAALSLTGFVAEKLSFVRTVLAQLAASFAGFVTPPSVGGVAVNVRYLRASKVSLSGAATSVALSQVVNAVLHALLLVVFTAATGASSHPNLPIPSWVFLAVGGLAVLVGIALAVPAPRRWILARVLPPLREAAPRMLELLTSPLKLTEAVGGTLLLNACYIAALWCAVLAFAGSVSLTAVAVVYLAAAAVASVAPTPGGLGAVEIALSTGLTAAGMAGAAAVSAVLLYRLATYWLPVPVGWLATRALQHAHAL
jgi:uncharacterized membrane protein YbhN (UPF0104 family)